MVTLEAFFGGTGMNISRKSVFNANNVFGSPAATDILQFDK